LTGTSVKDSEKKVFRIATKRSFFGRRVEKKSEKKEKKDDEVSKRTFMIFSYELMLEKFLNKEGVKLCPPLPS
jgi:hypothetical protein